MPVVTGVGVNADGSTAKPSSEVVVVVAGAVYVLSTVVVGVIAGVVSGVVVVVVGVVTGAVVVVSITVGVVTPVVVPSVPVDEALLTTTVSSTTVYPGTYC